MNNNKILNYLLIAQIFILFLNNIFYLLKINYNSFSIKYSDKLFMKFCLNTFHNISYELNRKFNFHNKKLLNISNLSTLSDKKKTIILFFEDNNNHIIKYLIKLLQKKYIVNISSNNPDYLIYNVFGCNHLNKKYKNAIKIAILSENQIPDFNIADYAIGHSHINYLDRYYKFPSYFINYLKSFESFINYKLEIEKNHKNNSKKKFCAALISNYKITDYFRLNFIDELNKYKKVDMGGKYKNNVGEVKNKIEFLSSYKFSIAMENTEGDGYVSEKIVQSFISGNIPIYYGDYMIDEFINPKAFILIRGEKDMMKKIDYIKQIDRNDELYRNILKENIFIDKKILNTTIKDYYEFLLHIFEQDKNFGKRTDKNNKYF